MSACPLKQWTETTCNSIKHSKQFQGILRQQRVKAESEQQPPHRNQSQQSFSHKADLNEQSTLHSGYRLLGLFHYQYASQTQISEKHFLRILPYINSRSGQTKQEKAMVHTCSFKPSHTCSPPELWRSWKQCVVAFPCLIWALLLLKYIGYY